VWIQLILWFWRLLDYVQWLYIRYQYSDNKHVSTMVCLRIELLIWFDFFSGYTGWFFKKPDSIQEEILILLRLWLLQVVSEDISVRVVELQLFVMLCKIAPYKNSLTYLLHVYKFLNNLVRLMNIK